MSFLRKQESSKKQLDSHFRGNDTQERARPVRAATARERHAGRLRGPLCHSCVSGSPGFFAPPPVSLPRKRQSRTTLDSLGPASYPAALKQAPSSLHCSSRRSVPSAASFGYTVPLRRTGHGRCSAHGSAEFFRAVWINQATMWRRPLGEETPIFSTISHQRADDVP